MYQFIKLFLENKMSIFEEYGAFKAEDTTAEDDDILFFFLSFSFFFLIFLRK